MSSCSIAIQGRSNQYNLEVFHNEEAFIKERPNSTALHGSGEPYRLEQAKRELKVLGAHTGRMLYDTLLGYKQLAQATTVRLAQADLYHAFNQMLRPHRHALQLFHTDADCFWLSVVGVCLTHNLRRAEWSSEQLVQLVSEAFDDNEDFFDEYDVDFEYVLRTVFKMDYPTPGRADHSTWQQTCLEAIRQVRPPTEVCNQRFWFEFLCCDEDSGNPYLNGETSDMLTGHVENLPVKALVALVNIIKDEEEEMISHLDRESQSNILEYDYEFAVTRHVLRSWPRAALHAAEDLAIFTGLIGSLGDAVLPCSLAMSWVHQALDAGNVATAKAIATVLKA